MKKQFLTQLLFVFVLLLLGASTHLTAQANQATKTPEQRATLQTEKLSEVVQLTAAQKSEIYQLKLATIQKRMAHRQLKGEAKKAARQSFEQDRKNTQQAIQAILTPTQKALWKKHQAERKAARKR